MDTIKKVIESAETTVSQVTTAITTDAKSRDLQTNTVDECKKGVVITTNFGTKITHTDDSLKAGPRGPILMEDFHFREKITHFDHEPIPERVVHARGSGAHGYFQVYESLEQYTTADFLCDPNKKTPVFVRFSTVLGSRGSSDTVRDVRGFATKFYTDQGNFDLVGNNIPVFFIQDAIKFPDVIHAGKPEPHHEIPQAQTAHDNFWDFISLTPETTHMAMWTLSDRAIPRSYRMMQGFGVNTFVFVNAEGRRRFVKFHWEPLLGTHSLVWDEAMKLNGVDPDFHRRDLWEAIQGGQYPEYELCLQIVDIDEAEKFDFDILDATKIIPEELVPLKKVGKMVLNRNPDNFFAETEQIAYHTGHLVPGIEPSDDPLLQGRMFSYLDTQLTRLGGPNFEEIPINRPICPVTNNQRRGFHRMRIDKGQVNYFPNRFGCPGLATLGQGGYAHAPAPVHGNKVRARGPKFNEHYAQARMFYNGLSDWERKHLIRAACFELGKCDDVGVRERMVERFSKIDFHMATQVAQAIGVAPPSADTGGPVKTTMTSRAVSQDMHSPKNSIQSRKVAFLVGPGFNFAQLSAITSGLAAMGTVNLIVGPFKGDVQGDSGTRTAQFSYFTCKSVMFDAVVIVGGSPSITTLSASGDAMAFVMEAFKHCKPIAAVDEGVDFLMSLHVPGLKCAPQGTTDVMDCQGVVTMRNFDASAMQMGEKMTFGKSLFNAMAVHRHFDRDDTKVPA